VDVLVNADVGGERGAAAVGGVQRRCGFEEFWPPGVPRHEDVAVAGRADLESGEHAADRRPAEFFEREAGALREIEAAGQAGFVVEERVRLVDHDAPGNRVPGRGVPDVPVARVRRFAGEFRVPRFPAEFETEHVVRVGGLEQHRDEVRCGHDDGVGVALSDCAGDGVNCGFGCLSGGVTVDGEVR